MKNDVLQNGLGADITPPFAPSDNVVMPAPMLIVGNKTGIASCNFTTDQASKLVFAL